MSQLKEIQSILDGVNNRDFKILIKNIVMKFVINILAILFGWFLGSLINLGLIQLGHKLFPIVGLDLNDMVALAELMPTLEFEFFIFPFLAHALGTLVGATTAGFI